MPRLRLPSPSMAVSLVALSVALGGTSYAAVAITGKDVRNSSLTGTDVRNSSLTGADVRNSALTGADIKNRSLSASDFRAGQLPRGATGPAGATGPQGPKGDPGAAAPRTRWVLVNAAGQIEAQSGGFTVQSGYVGNPAGAAGNVYIDAGEDLSDNGIVATMALQNAVDQDGDGVMNGRAPGADANPEFAGEISATRCAIPGVVTCAPAGTNVPTSFVVSPRNSDGTVTADGARKRFYVAITG